MSRYKRNERELNRPGASGTNVSGTKWYKNKRNDKPRDAAIRHKAI